MTALEWVLFLAPCDVPECGLPSRWTQNRDDRTTRVDCPTHPHREPMAALHAYLRRPA